ncbi:MAG: TonB-dependent receptor [Prolixibacteraceae bacterium]|jgi:TonB-linked SusC/RagA family outer membrane protein|nr:TonB-dependent receptor [Prolixibacteraceae bacterium]
MKKEKHKFREIQKVFFLFLTAMILSVSGFSQNVVSGTVSSTDGELIPGATIVIQGTSNGTISDIDGKFSISAAKGDFLVVSFVGMKSTVIKVSEQTQVQVSLDPDVIGLEEIVAIGYGTMKKSDLTGATVSANIEAFRESPNTSIMQSLKGAVPGVQIGQVNTAGSEPSLSVRGQTTLGGNASPLIVLDGVIYRGRITDINPSDIESVDILKDASSMAIYGAQAANGVFLITSKKGNAGTKPIVNFSSSFSTQTPTSNARLLNSEEVLQKVRDIEYESSYMGPDYTQSNPDWDPSVSSELMRSYVAGIDAGTDFDWYGEATDPGYIIDNQLSFSGGTENTTYFLSGGHTDQKGFVLNDHYKRNSVRINIKTEITNWFTLGANVFGSFTDYSGVSPNFESLAFSSPLVNAKDENGKYIVNPFNSYQLNPFLSPSSEDKETNNNLSGNFFAILSIPQIKGLTYQVNYSNNLRTGYHAKSNVYGAGLNGSAYKSNNSTIDAMLDNIVTYDKKINQDHSIKVTLVAGYNTVDYEATRASGSDIPNLGLSYNSLEQAIIQEISSDAWSESSIYQMGRVNYNFSNKYLLTGTVRRDGFSGFAKNKKFGIFPSIGAGWVMTEESFFKVPVIDYLKLRGSYGVNGNQTGRYTSLARISAEESSKYVFGDGSPTSVGQSVSSLPNNDLGWETTAGFNMGLDFAILNSRIRGNVEYYNTTTTDLLWNKVLPTLTGFNRIKTNLGEIANQGLEFALQTTPVKTSNFRWDLDVNFSTNKNKIVKLLGEDLDGDGKEDDLVASNLFIGQSIGTIYDFEVDGIWQLADEIPDGYGVGRYRLVDQNPGDTYAISAESDRKVLGHKEPAYQFGILNTLNYKSFTLRFFVNSIQGGKNGYLGSNNPDGMPGTTGTAQNQNWYNFYDYWSVSNPDAKYPVSWTPTAIAGAAYYTRSFVRLQDVSLAYNLKSATAKKYGFGALKVFVSGKNLLTFTNWDGWDPETGQGIGNNQGYPVMKSVSAGIEVSF